MLVEGDWQTDVEPHTDEEGAFDRVTTSFRDWIRGTHRSADDVVADGPEPEASRYHLYIARNCPWAHGAALTRRLAGLTDAVSMDIVDPVREDDGWEFTPEKEGCTPDTVNGADYLRELYVAADPEYTGRVTVPVFWDTQEDTIVNNALIEIMRMFATAFDDVGDEGVDLYPEGYREEVDRIVTVGAGTGEFLEEAGRSLLGPFGEAVQCLLLGTAERVGFRFDRAAQALGARVVTLAQEQGRS
jgi:putative glutathione S-transferase